MKQKLSIVDPRTSRATTHRILSVSFLPAALAGAAVGAAVVVVEAGVVVGGTVDGEAVVPAVPWRAMYMNPDMPHEVPLQVRRPSDRATERSGQARECPCGFNVHQTKEEQQNGKGGRGAKTLTF